MRSRLGAPLLLLLACAAASAGVVQGPARAKTVFGPAPGWRWNAVAGQVVQTMGLKGIPSLETLTPVVNALNVGFDDFNRLAPEVRQERLIAAVERAKQSVELAVIRFAGAADAANPSLGLLNESLTGCRELLADFAAYLTSAQRERLEKARLKLDSRIAEKLELLGWSLVADAATAEGAQAVSPENLSALERGDLDVLGFYAAGEENLGDVRKLAAPGRSELLRALAVSAVIARLAKADGLAEKHSQIQFLHSHLRDSLGETATALSGRQAAIVKALAREARMDAKAVEALEEVALAAIKDDGAGSPARRIVQALRGAAGDKTVPGAQRARIAEALRLIDKALEKEVASPSRGRTDGAPGRFESFLRRVMAVAERADAALSRPATMLLGIVVGGVVGSLVALLLSSFWPVSAPLLALAWGAGFAAGLAAVVALSPASPPRRAALEPPAAFQTGSNAEVALIRFIDRASESLELGQPLESYTPAIQEAIERARRRGVRIVEPGR